MNRAEVGVPVAAGPAVTGQRITNEDGSVEYRLTMVRRELGKWQTDIGTVGVKRLQLDQKEPLVAIDVTSNPDLQGNAHWMEERVVYVNPNTQNGADKIASNATLLVDVGGLLNSNGQRT